MEHLAANEPDIFPQELETKWRINTDIIEMQKWLRVLC